MIGGSPISVTDVERCMQDVDAVIHCLGIGGKGNGQPTTLVSDSVKVVLSAMQHETATRPPRAGLAGYCGGSVGV